MDCLSHAAIVPNECWPFESTSSTQQAAESIERRRLSSILCHLPPISLPSSKHTVTRPPVRLNISAPQLRHLYGNHLYTALESKNRPLIGLLPLRSKLNANLKEAESSERRHLPSRATAPLSLTTHLSIVHVLHISVFLTVAIIRSLVTLAVSYSSNPACVPPYRMRWGCR